MSFWKWSRTASANATADGSINWAEGQAPSTVNDSARAMMAAAAKFRDDISGAIVTGGAASAYTVASYQVFDTLAHLDGAMIAFTPHITSGSPVTLNVDGLGAKALRLSPGVDLPAGTLVQGTPYAATYNNAVGEFYLQGLAGNPYNIPLGGMLEFTGTTAPNGSFVLPFGQAISRTTYAAYFAMVGTTYGAGDGSTTFNVIDKRGRVSAGKDDMGGNAADRIGTLSTDGGTIVGTTMGSSGGSQSHTQATNEVGVHSHGITDNGHTHNTGYLNGSTFIQSDVGIVNTNNSENIGYGQQLNTSARTLRIASNTTGISINNSASNVAMAWLQPTIIVNYILRVL